MTARPAVDRMEAGSPLTSQRRPPQRGEQLRVLMSIDAVGGVWRYAMELARAMRLQGIGFVFAGFGPPPRADQRQEAERLGTLVWTDQPLDWMVDDTIALAGIPGRLAALADEYEVDLLHLNLPSQACGLDFEVPVLVMSHSCVVSWWKTMRGTPLPANWQWQKALNRAGFARADAVVAPSASHADLICRCYGPIAGLSVVHNALGGSLHGTPKENFILAAGRWWDEGKNAAILDAAAATTRWPIMAAGAVDGPNGARTSMPHTVIVNELAHEALLRLTRRAAIVVSPSFYEPFGLAALEGARAGAALVLSDIATYRELWDGAALFFAPQDADALAASLCRLIDDPALRRVMGRRALVRSRRFSPDAQAAAMAALYGRLCGMSLQPLSKEG